MARCVTLVVIALLVAPGFSDAESWIGRIRALNVAPNDSSETIGTTGTGADVESAWTVELDLTYKLTDNWGIEAIAGTAKHDIVAANGALDGADLGSVAHLPPTFTLLYFFDTAGSFHPYIGVGLNYTLFYDYDLSDDLAGIGVVDLDFDESFGFAGDFGFDIDMGEKWLFNVDVKYIDISTDVEIQLEDGGVLDTITVDIDPWVIGIGVGTRF